MASRNLDGCSVIKAAEQRLAFAKKCEQMAQRQLEAAQAQLKAAQDEAKAASSFLDSTRDKLQVIDVDNEDDDDTSRDGRKSKRKVSLSPNNGREKKARTEANVAAPASRPGPTVASTSTTPSNGRENAVKQILVEGAGVDEANGTYELLHQSSSNDAPQAYYDLRHADKTVPSWYRLAWRNDEPVRFFIFRSTYTKRWYFASSTATCAELIYNKGENNTDMPLQSKWSKDPRASGCGTPPLLKW